MIIVYDVAYEILLDLLVSDHMFLPSIHLNLFLLIKIIRADHPLPSWAFHLYCAVENLSYFDSLLEMQSKHEF